MIKEWQPILPGDKRKLDKRKLYEFLREDTTTFIIVGIGEEAFLDAVEDVVAWREYDTRPPGVWPLVDYSKEDPAKTAKGK